MKEIKVKRLTDKDINLYRITLSLKIGDNVTEREIEVNSCLMVTPKVVEEIGFSISGKISSTNSRNRFICLNLSYFWL